MKHSLNSEELSVTSDVIHNRGERQLWARIILSCYYSSIGGNLACRNFFKSQHFETLAGLLGLDAVAIRERAMNALPNTNKKRTYTSICERNNKCL